MTFIIGTAPKTLPIGLGVPISVRRQLLEERHVRRPRVRSEPREIVLTLVLPLEESAPGGSPRKRRRKLSFRELMCGVWKKF